MDKLELTIIGKVHSCFPGKFGIPRQPGLVPHAEGYLEIIAPFHVQEAFSGLEEFSHIWVQFVFHDTMQQGWKPRVRPPRLGGNQSVGVFATRSMFRPNPVGLSLLKLESIEFCEHCTRLHVSGLDLLDQTPILDIKPYLPYAEALPAAQAGFASEPPGNVLEVSFSGAALATCQMLEDKYPHLKELISEILACDPRPAYRQLKDSGESYAMCLYEFNVSWQVDGNHATVIEISTTDD